MSDLLPPNGLSVSQFIGLRPGPKLTVLGAVHGNETCGTEAIQRTRQEITIRRYGGIGITLECGQHEDTVGRRSVGAFRKIYAQAGE